MRTAAPIHAHCYNTILSVLEKAVPVGARLPPQMDLATRCQVSQATVSRALRELQKTGLVARDGEGLRLCRKPAAKHALPQPVSLSRRDEVERRILAMLTTGELRPGTTFSELALARKFGVTTGTVREALLKLARLGIFAKPARRQWQFVRLNVTSINQLMDLRILVEPFALKEYFHQSRRNMQPFVDLLERTQRFRKSLTLDDRHTWLDWDTHCAILQASGNPYLMEHFQFAIVATQMQWHYYDARRDFQRMAQGAVSDHIRILRAILAGKEAVALASLHAHLQKAKSELLQIHSGS